MIITPTCSVEKLTMWDCPVVDSRYGCNCVRILQIYGEGYWASLSEKLA